MEKLITFVVGVSLVAAGILFVWGVLGLLVGIFRYLVTPPPPAPPGPCATCTQLQALWNSMTFFEKTAAFMNFALASAGCAAIGCGWLVLL